jgi:hypothetical protein
LKTDPNQSSRKFAAAAITVGLLIAGPIVGASAALADDGPPEPGQTEFRGPSGDAPIEPGQHEFRPYGDNAPGKRQGNPPPSNFFGS